MIALRKPKTSVIVRQQVRDLLEQSPAYGKLPLDRQRKIVRDMVKIGSYLSEPQGTVPVNFPDFVSDLIKGVFQSVVNSSIQQMEAYAELVRDVAKTVDQFTENNVTESAGRDFLISERKKRRRKVALMISTGIRRIAR